MNEPGRKALSPVLATVLLAAPLLAGIAYLRSGSEAATGPGPVPIPSPDTPSTVDYSGWNRLETETLEGGRFPLSSLSGKPLVLDFWATWCRPCQPQREVLHQLAGEYGDRLRIVALAVDEDLSAVKQYVKDHAAVSYELRASVELLQLFRVEALPTLVIIDATGRVQSVSTGLRDAAQLRRILAPLMQ